MVVAFDMRHHGETTRDRDDDSVDFSRETLTHDIVALWRVLFAETQPPTVLVGHSVGGALAVWTCLLDADEGIPSLEGLVVIDVVEGTALGATSALLQWLLHSCAV